MVLKTVQIAPIRTLMVALKDILLETNIVFTKSGMKIVNMDKSHTVLVHLSLDADKFEMYECLEDKIIIGVNMTHLFKLITTIDNDDTLTIYIDADDYDGGIVRYLGLKFENTIIHQEKTQKLRLIEPEHEELTIPDVHFSSVLNMPSADFQKIVRDLGQLSDKLEIKSIVSDQTADLIFKCTGCFASAEVRRSEYQGGMEFIQKGENSSIVQGEFSLRNLGYFIKCTNLCSQIELYLANDLPLVVKYSVASLGEIKLCLAQLPSTSEHAS